MAMAAPAPLCEREAAEQNLEGDKGATCSVWRPRAGRAQGQQDAGDMRGSLHPVTISGLRPAGLLKLG
ncbi:hypothetical protein PR202_ga05341 [Eleusine coracana subsp. coracana]|uniref:Uncharacterized protein n=1 Tax=Eleusine coracana subsp. coracana TaxID=191504 RepID=A0AAV5BTS6_ELECO|nr:hypothetical protein PR202_ga04888 [Eleusine coracana subsp. coracana]GJM89179.1 hypothetical protein PR202_ga05341 [Eleusine coracana subsp. coracana]